MGAALSSADRSAIDAAIRAGRAIKCPTVYLLPVAGASFSRKQLMTNDHLKSFVERLERLMAERDALNADIAEVMDEAKGAGFDGPTLRAVVRERRKDQRKRQQQLDLFDTYWSAVA